MSNATLMQDAVSLCLDPEDLAGMHIIEAAPYELPCDVLWDDDYGLGQGEYHEMDRIERIGDRGWTETGRLGPLYMG